MKLRVPFDPDYVALLGKAIYLFAYYEWIIIYIIEKLDSGFLKTYSRGERPLTSGNVGQRFGDAIRASCGLPPEDRKALDVCADEFRELIPRRNALVHAHPITDTDGSQILSYQTSPARSLPDVKWDEVSIKDFLIAADAAVGRAASLYERISSRS